MFLSQEYYLWFLYLSSNMATQKQAELASGSTLTIEKWKAEQTATVGKNSNLSMRPLYAEGMRENLRTSQVL